MANAMICPAATSEDSIVLGGMSWAAYQAITEALAGHSPGAMYDRGTFSLPREIAGVSWREYEAFLRGAGDVHIRHIYDRGTLVLMSPLKSHDWIKRLIGRFVESLAFDQRLPIQSIGSTTITDPRFSRGFEADEAYYIANEPHVRGKIDFEPGIDPPPDLIIEVDVTSSSQQQLDLYAAMKVPEVWLHNSRSLSFLHRSRRGKYRAGEHSLAFPFLAPLDIERFLARYAQTDETELCRQFVAWARKRRKSHLGKRP
jgi:Uma2 family endonuclease